VVTLTSYLMKFGFVLPNNWGLPDPLVIGDLAAEAEELGLESVWVNHHVLNIGYIADRLDDRPYYDALTTLTWVAARTERVRLGTSVLVLPYLHPMVLAKTLATLDQLSGGRVIAGLGVGSLAEENAAMRVEYERRGPWSDEFIEVMLALWSDGPGSFEGDHFAMSGLVASPKPAQNDLEIWIGGSGAPARKRAARFGQAWHPLTSVGGLAKRMPKMIDTLEAAGRSRNDLIVAPRITVDAVPDMASVEAWAAAGADQLIIGTTGDDIDVIRQGLAHVGALAKG
jgi:probable F420-dependent oxidoreductase